MLCECRSPGSRGPSFSVGRSAATLRNLGNRGWDILKGGPPLADRAETADHINKDATDRYAPCLRGGPFTCVVLVGAL